MLYLIAVLMGYVIIKNIRVSRAAQHDIGSSFVSPTANIMVSLGGLAGWFCVIPAAYFAGSADGSGFLQGLLFVVAALLGGGILGTVVSIPGLNQLIAVLALPINVGLAVLTYFITRS